MFAMGPALLSSKSPRVPDDYGPIGGLVDGLWAAYALTKLSDLYSGPALKVRRSSDDALQDIGFVGNALDTSALSSFLGANDGYAHTWFDQSGEGNDLIQATATYQPRVATAGTSLNGLDYALAGSPTSSSARMTTVGVTLSTQKKTVTYRGIARQVNVLNGTLWHETNGLYCFTDSNVQKLATGCGGMAIVTDGTAPDPGLADERRVDWLDSTAGTWAERLEHRHEYATSFSGYQAGSMAQNLYFGAGTFNYGAASAAAQPKLRALVVHMRLLTTEEMDTLAASL